jgi:outer membrane immunogenic protein
MRRISLALLAASALSGVAVQDGFAAEPAATDWTGFYLGGNFGYSWGTDDVSATGLAIEDFSLPANGSTSLKPTGFIGGLQAGYNWEFAPHWVVGLETDFQWTGQKNSVTQTATISSGSCFSLGSGNCSVTGASGSANITTKLDWLGTFRGRFGYVVDRALVYGTAGLAYGHVQHSLAGSLAGTFFDSSNCEGGCPIGGSFTASSSAINLGWVLGAGIEGFLPNTNNWIWRVEYLYADLVIDNVTVPFNASATINGLGITPESGTFTYNLHFTDQIVRAALSYKF